MSRVRLGVCYYPEHWPAVRWPADAQAMRALGLAQVRIGEFAWSRIEPEPGRFDWGWLDQAVDALADAGLAIVMGTPTACPPAWLIAANPDMLPVGTDGRARGFGSRRHYSFSSAAYRDAARAISERMAARYGAHEAVVGWQLDNEYGCHETTECFSPAALHAFRAWCRARYGDVAALNEAWGNVFWSQEYGDFAEIGLPLAVTETNPAHRMAWRRFSSDQVRAFNRAMAEAVRPHIGDAWLTHNFMGDFTAFDHFAVGADLDVASWDSYPLGFLDQGAFDDDTKARYRQRGHPDWAGFHHDLYRAVGRGRFGVMEQQPGAVNWAPHNAQPAPGMMRLWGWEAIAHGAEFVSWFRWRQAPFAQEQFHAGLQHADGSRAEASDDVERLAGELADIDIGETAAAPVALVFDYEDAWVSDIQPQSAGFSALSVALDWYGAARRLGLDVDIVPSDAGFDGRALVLLPCRTMLSADAVARLDASGAHWLAGPRSGSRSDEFRLPDALPPGPLQSLMPLRVTSIDALRPGVRIGVDGLDDAWVHQWLETIDSPLVPALATRDGRGLWYRQGRGGYVAGRCSPALLGHILRRSAGDAGLAPQALPRGLRLRRRGRLCFAFNYDNTAKRLPVDTPLLMGSSPLPPGDVAIWRLPGDG